MDEDASLTANQRLKKLRKTLKLTQIAFSKMLTISCSHLACIETERRFVNDRIIKLACDSFRANETWLRTGQGEMFAKDRSSEFAKLNALFADLQPQYQDFILNAVDLFLKMQDNG
ncbi:hypothetical protein FACS1894151_01580 [Spirochaetia bacterium]|nr:hypothetical protein FACS1894151_01580 [Spirochaetia bacterium]